MVLRSMLVGCVLLRMTGIASATPAAREFVRQAVRTELAADNNDHSRWLYYDVDRKPGATVDQWVADTGESSLHRVMKRNGQPASANAQRSQIDAFIGSPSAQARQQKANQHDDKQSADLLKLLPDAFLWTQTGERDGGIFFHFTPDPDFNPPTWASRVFAAMAGDLEIDAKQHRIVSLRGRLVHPVRFCGGLCGSIDAGGTVNVERRQTGPGIWQIVETHVHIHGTILFFKSISQSEDEVKSRFERLPDNVTLRQAESDLMKKG